MTGKYGCSLEQPVRLKGGGKLPDVGTFIYQLDQSLASCSEVFHHRRVVSYVFKKCLLHFMKPEDSLHGFNTCSRMNQISHHYTQLP
jgi:hypothetical protein